MVISADELRMRAPPDEHEPREGPSGGIEREVDLLVHLLEPGALLLAGHHLEGKLGDGGARETGGRLREDVRLEEGVPALQRGKGPATPGPGPPTRHPGGDGDVEGAQLPHLVEDLLRRSASA